MTVFKAIEMEDYKDEPLQYVGVYVLRWRPEWGEPTVGFVEDDATEERLEALEALKEIAEDFVEDSKQSIELEEVAVKWFRSYAQHFSSALEKIDSGEE